MSSKSNDLGRAFEYACVVELKNQIENRRAVLLDQESLKAAKRAWNIIDEHQQNEFLIAASAFIETLFECEPLILEGDCPNDILMLSINKDSDAENGDVRDIIISRERIQWNIGLSMKHNHFAAKHSRLSSRIDFGEKWYGTACDQTYWNAVNPIFHTLKQLKEDGVKWNELTDKSTTVYAPILNAFQNELMRAYQQDRTLPTRLLSYLLGTKDFYKVVAIDKKRMTEFQPFNLRGELNRHGKHNRPIRLIPVASLPTEIITIRMKPESETTMELYMNNGWSLSFRLHNASKVVEPSLKFDVQIIGVPSNIITINCIWK